MNGTYEAVEMSTAGVFRVVGLPISKPVAGQIFHVSKHLAFVIPI